MDAKTFETRFMPSRKKIFAVAYRIVGGVGEAEDVVQDVYLKLWQMRDQLDMVLQAEAYAITMTKHLSIDYLRSSKHFAEDDTLQESWADEPDTSQQERLESKDLLSQTLDYIEHLPEPQRTVMRLRHLEDASCEEIEQATGLSAENVRVILSRTRKKLKEWLNKR